MKKIIIIMFCTLILNANQDVETKSSYKNWLSNNGYFPLISLVDNDKNKYGYGVHIGAVSENTKIYLSYENYLYRENTLNVDLEELSINYDYIFLKQYDYRPYIGVGLGLLSIDSLNTLGIVEESQSKVIGNTKIGLSFYRKGRSLFSIGVKKLYYNSNLIDEDVYTIFITLDIVFKK